MAKRAVATKAGDELPFPMGSTKTDAIRRWWNSQTSHLDSKIADVWRASWRDVAHVLKTAGVKLEAPLSEHAVDQIWRNVGKANGKLKSSPRVEKPANVSVDEIENPAAEIARLTELGLDLKSWKEAIHALEEFNMKHPKKAVESAYVVGLIEAAQEQFDAFQLQRNTLEQFFK